ncbi:MAG TPA: sigma-70 family RNA polymerase sigma factor [Planctomycetota bacterium]|nr:sigma-70 family RNA polymerase sigma factor [Planctomycetota bacterium]
MARYRNALIGELARQFAYTPRKRKVEQLGRLRQFAPHIQPNQAYPYDFVVFQITRFRPDDAPHAVFDGASLKADLMTLLHEVSDSLNLSAAEAGSPVLRLEEVRRTYDVSLKTLRRWRVQGLVTLRFVFADGRKLSGVCQSDLEAFVESHPEIIGRTRAYSYLDGPTRRAILARAFELSLTYELTATEAAGRLAREFGCAHDAVRRVLRDYEQAHPDTAIFAPCPHPLSDEERRQLLALYRNGYQPRELARSFHLGATTLDYAMREVVVEEILGRDWQYVASPEFERPDAEQGLLDDLAAGAPDERDIEGPLGGEQEERLFRQYNLAKCLLAHAREELRPSELTDGQLRRLVHVHDLALAARNCLVVANLRLVIHLASRHLGSGRRLDDLVSDGTVSLMQAIEKFDAARGVRFSTYASWAIRKNFAKSLPREAQRHQAEMTGTGEIIESHGDERAVAPPERDFKEVIRSTVAALLLELSPREREVIVARFGVGRHAETLEQIGRRFQVTRERVRQIEASALRKLATLVDPALVRDLVASRE